MKKDDEISSTKKLLNVIRNDIESTGSSANTPHQEDHGLKRFFEFGSKKKGLNIGIEISCDSLNLVKCEQKEEKNRPKIICGNVPFNPSLRKNPDKFSAFLKETLNDFCGHVKNVNLWSALSPDKVEIRYFLIPKVPRKEIAKTVYWAFKKEIGFDENEFLFDFEIMGNINIGKVQKIKVIGYIAPRAKINELKEIFANSSFPLTGISTVPFAFQTLFRSNKVKTNGNNVINLHIDMDWSYIDIFQKDGDLLLSRGVKAGLNSMARSIYDSIGTSADIDNKTLLMEAHETGHDLIKKKDDACLDQAWQILNFLMGKPGSSTETDLYSKMSKEEIFKMLKPALDRLIRQVIMTHKHFLMHNSQEKIAKIYISGEISIYQYLIDYIGEQLDLPAEATDSLASFDVNSFLSGSAKRADFSVATGMALSINMNGPNFIFPYKEKEKKDKALFINYAIFGCFIVLAGILMGYHLWLDHLVKGKETDILQLRNKIASYSTYVNKDLLISKISDLKNNRQALQKLSNNYLGIVIVKDLAASLPEKIRLFNLHYTSLESSDREESKNKLKNNLILDGAIFGNRQTFDFILAAYMRKLKSLDTIINIKVNTSALEEYNNREIMHFTANLELG